MQPDLQPIQLADFITRGFTYLNRSRREARILNIRRVAARIQVAIMQKHKSQGPAQCYGLLADLAFYQNHLKQLNQIPGWVNVPEPYLN